MIFAGFGFRASATLDSLASALQAASGSHIDGIAAPADKAQSDIFRSFAASLGLPVQAIAQTDLQVAETLSHSDKVMALRGTGSVAEACALTAAGSNATLLGPRQVSKDRLATCALAEGSSQ